MGFDRLDSLAILDALAPEPGWTVDVALLSSYSVDLVAAAAIVMALAGEGDDHEQMHRAGLARACERMRGRFRIICQAGRISVPGPRTEALILLADQWIREVHHNGNERSWHAKLGLVRYRKEQEANVSQQVVWRLWVGSRNLTRDTSWDSAVIAVGRPSGKPSREAESIARAGSALALQAALPDWPVERIEDDLNTLKWAWPEEVIKVDSFDFWTDSDSCPGFPDPPPGADRVIAVSPFIDFDSAKKMASWGGDVLQRQLLTIPRTMAALEQHPRHPLDGFTSLHQIEGPLAFDDPDEVRDPTEDDQMLEIHRGLHAKLIWAQTPKADHLWLGSANLTRRAWDGRNCEVMVHLRVAASVGKGLSGGLVEGLAIEVQPSLNGELDLVQEDENAKHLDSLRNRIAGTWTTVLKSNDFRKGLALVSKAPLLSLSDKASLKVRLLGTPDYHEWPIGETIVHLPGVSIHQQTELLELALSSATSVLTAVKWLARAPLHPEPGLERDRAVLAKLMGPRAFLAWLGTMLDEVRGDESDQCWPDNGPSPSLRPSEPGTLGILSLAPTLESILRAWARNQESVLQVDRAVQTWAKDIASMASGEMNDAECSAMTELARFVATWQTLRSGLGLDEARK